VTTSTVEPTGQALDRRRWGAAAGLLALFAGLGVAELLAGVSPQLRSPVVGVSNTFIDNVPLGLKTWAIERFGTNDKAVLLVGIVVVVGFLAMIAGHLAAHRSVRWGDGFAVALSLVAILAILSGRNGSLIACLPSLLAGIIGGVSLRWMVRLLNSTPAAQSATFSPPTALGVSRRTLMQGAVVAAGLVAVGAALKQRGKRTAAVAKERLAVLLPVAKKVLPAPPADPAIKTPGLSPLYTPNDGFYRIDTAIEIPQVNASSWKLRIEGYVDKPRMYTYDDLLKRDLIELDCTIACVSNEVGGGLIGNARWLGVRLDDLLAEAGIQSKADQVLCTSVDSFTAGFPVDLLDGRDAIVAIAMNGQPLPVLHGYPARIIVPGIYGYVSATKWLSSIKLTRFDEEIGYWIDKGWSAEAPIKTQSRIDRPTGRITTAPTVIAGVAWAPTIGIDKVEVQVGEGPWQLATLGPEVSANCWRQWWLPWTPTAGTQTMRCRATDRSGYTQTSDLAPVAPDGATGWHERTVLVER
jgi:DMSO/TMAO reductase YedYZ molybdopterin-dependent catalytic subunit